MSAQANFLSVPRNASCSINTANANRDGTGALGTVMTGGARSTGGSPPLLGGARIDKLAIQAVGTTTAGMIRLFTDDGTVKRLVGEVPVDPVTPGANERAWACRLSKDNSDILPIMLADGVSLKAATEKGETFHVTVIEGGDF